MDEAANCCPESESAEGLSAAEARARLAQDGYNELPAATKRSTLNMVLGVAREPMFVLLIVSVVIYLTLGDLREALVLSLSPNYWIFDDLDSEHGLSQVGPCCLLWCSLSIFGRIFIRGNQCGIEPFKD